MRPLHPHEDKSTAPELITFRDEVYFEAFSVDQGKRLDAFLSRQMDWRSRTSIQRLVHEGQVAVVRRGERSVANKPSATMMDRDVVYVKLPKPKRDVDASATAEQDPTLHIIYEDRWLIGLDKPPNVPVHPAGRNLYRTVITALHRRYRRLDNPELDIVPKLCHRLDLETSGVLLVAKDDRAHREVQRLIRERVPKKQYLAIVHGCPESPRGVIELPLGPSVGRKVYQSRAVRFDDLGQPSKTGYEVLESVAAKDGVYSVLRLDLFTGRPHQIRVHLQAIGHSIVGDKIYGADEELFLKYYAGTLDDDDRARLELPRHALHAHRLTLPHPITGDTLEIVAKLPPDLQAFLDGKRTEGAERTDGTAIASDAATRVDQRV